VPFGVLTAALTPEILLRGLNEVLARACHDTYLRKQLAAGEPPGPPSLVPWEDLPESLRDSNRRFADGIGTKLDAVGAVIVPAPLVDPSGALPSFTEAELERLARDEHDRWMEDLLRDGWRHTTGEKAPEQRLHPLLVPWEELSEPEREKDRDVVREIPLMLARAGYEMHRPDGQL
jgi:hypothetical protein